jgi:hypothetical protein
MNLRRARAKLRRRKDLARSPGRLVLDRMVGQLYVDLGGDHRDTVFLGGSGRAGTTWVSDVINHDGDYRYVFEPFHPNRLKIVANFRPRQYLRPDDRDPAYLKPADEILSGRIRSIWTDKYNRAHLPKKRLIKEVRGNLLLGWMRRNFPGMPIILVLRHPCAVVSSQQKLPWNWHTDPDVFLSQEALMKDHLEPFREALAGVTDPFDRHVIVWCVENFVPLRQFSKGEIHLAFYEHLVAEPRLEFERMFSFLGRPFDQEALHGLGRPSAVSRSDSPVVVGGSSVDGWRQDVTAEQVERALRILALFGLDRVYGEDPMPRVEDPGALLEPAG